jgi:uncharacterized protein (DUF2062 family)
MSSLKSIKNFFYKGLSSGASSEMLAFSFSTGLYIAFSPFPGAHTMMVLFSKWMFRLNFPILFFATSLNNPWTMIPFFSTDYIFGYWLLHKVLNYHPGWQISLEQVFVSTKVCFWSFIVGGNVLGIVTAVLSYPIMKVVFKKIIQRRELKVPV